MIQPPYLNKGDKIGIISTARKVTKAEMEPAVRKIAEWGYIPVLGKNLFSQQNQFAGTDEERAADLQGMLDNNDIKAILCSRGGYGTIRIMEELRFIKFRKNPKWLIGFSDITALHSCFHQTLDCETIHGIMPINFPEDGTDNDSLTSLKKLISGEHLKYEFPSHVLNRKGRTDGVLCGGNLSMLYSLRGTNFDIDTSGKILFIEDVDEYLYHIDRMMMNLNLGEKLSGLNGLIVGEMSEMKDNTIPFGKTAYEIIAEAVEEYDYPVMYNFPAGHGTTNNAMIFGRKIDLKVAESSSFSF